MKSITHIETQEEKIEQNVNLHHFSKPAPQVARKGKIIIDKRQIPIIDRVLSALPRNTTVQVELDIKPAPELKIRDLSKLLQICVIGENTLLTEIPLRQHETPYVVEFNPDEVIDCGIVETCDDGSKDAVFPIDYTIILKRKGIEIDKLPCRIDVRIELATRVEPVVVFKPSVGQEDGVVFRSTSKEPVRIGSVQVFNSGKFFRSPALHISSLRIEGEINGNVISNLLYLGKDFESVGGRPLLNPMLKHEGNVGVDDKCSTPEWDSGKIEIPILPVQTESPHYLSIPVMMDMTRLSNPANDEIITIQAISVFRKHYESKDTKNTIVCEAGTIKLKRNTRIMDLEVFAGPDGSAFTSDCKIANKDTRELSAEYSGWTSENQAHPVLAYQFIINNSAEATEPGKGDAAVIINDIQVDKPYLFDGYSVELQEGKTLVGDMFSFGDIPSGTAIIKANSLPIIIPITYSDEFLVGMKDPENKEIYNTYIHIPIHFKYCLDKEGLYSEDPDSYKFLDFNATLKFRVFKRAKPEWFCLDFGTSAVVASFAKTLRDEERMRLLPLQDMKSQLDTNVWPNPKAREDAGEGSQYFISSATVLQSRSLEETLKQPNNYGSAAVLFSPPSIGYTEYYQRLLPCLKSLVGNSVIPNELIPPGTKQREKTDKKVEVKSVLQIIYSQLFKFFLPDRVKATERMVLSFPNTFAPEHISAIKEIAAASLKNVRPDYLRFISESDAVAFYYNHHRQTFINNSPDIDASEDFDKHVLVYDMGAGTLDLTYFIRSRVRTGKQSYKTRISIEGKMGVNKAGNYLDYILAVILIDRICEKESIKIDDEVKGKLKSILDINGASITRSLKDASVLKSYVKNNLKLILDAPEDTPLKGELQLFGTKIPVKEISVGDIISDTRYKDFLDEVTSEVFKNFISLFGRGEDSNRGLPLDLVIFSGRTTSIISLRNAVNKALVAFGQQSKAVLYADLSEKKYIDINEPVRNINSLKTVVVDGAMAYCRGKDGFELINSNVYATYGVFLIDNQGYTEWLPLIDYRTTPIFGENVISDDGIIIKQYDTQIHRAACLSSINPDSIDLSNYQEIIIVQTYSRTPLEDWKNGKREFISVIGSVELDGGRSSSKLRMRIDANNKIIFNIDNMPQTLLPHDDYESESFARAMWPIVRVIREQSNDNTLVSENNN